jgi:outer membrane protein
MIRTAIFLFTLFISYNGLCSKKEFKVAIVDVETILQKSSAMDGLKTALEEILKNLQSEFSNKQEELKNEEAKLLAQKEKLSPEEFEKKVEKFNQNVTRAQKLIQEKKLKFQQAHADAVSEVNAIAQKIISDISEEQGFSIVFPSTQVVYADQSLNITKEVIDRLNTIIPSVKLKF